MDFSYLFLSYPINQPQSNKCLQSWLNFLVRSQFFSDKKNLYAKLVLRVSDCKAPPKCITLQGVLIPLIEKRTQTFILTFVSNLFPSMDKILENCVLIPES